MNNPTSARARGNESRTIDSGGSRAKGCTFESAASDSPLLRASETAPKDYMKDYIYRCCISFDALFQKFLKTYKINLAIGRRYLLLAYVVIFLFKSRRDMNEWRCRGRHWSWLRSKSCSGYFISMYSSDRQWWQIVIASKWRWRRF